MTDKKMTDKEIIRALECCYRKGGTPCRDCPFNEFEDCNDVLMADYVFNLIKRQQAEIKRLNYSLLGVMHSVDKWLYGAELEQDEVNRAATMREKTLRTVEEKRAEIERLHKKVEELSEVLSDSIRIRYKEAKSEAVKEFAERLKKVWWDNSYESPDVDFDDFVDNLVKEMVGDEK